MKDASYAWIVVWATFSCLAVIFGVSYSFAAFFESFGTEFHAPRAEVALVFGLSGLIYFVGGAGAGLLSDRFGPRAVTSAGMLFIAAGLALSSFAPSIGVVYAAYGIGVGVGIALVYTPAMANVPPWFEARRALAAGIASAGIGAGTLVVPLLAAAAIEAWRWRGALQAMALGVLIIGLAAAALLRRAPAAVAARAGAAPGATLREAVTSADFRRLYLVCLLGGPAMFIPFAHASAAARDLGVAETQAVGLVGLIGIGSLSGRFAIGGLADRLGRRRTLALMVASMGASYLAWYAAKGYAAMAVFALWMGVSYGGIVALLPALCMDLFGARAVAAILGTLYTGAAFGNLAGPWAAGAVFDRFGSYTPVIWGCIAGCAAATWAALKIEPAQPR